MYWRSKLNVISQLVVVLATVLGLKSYHSTASVNQLRWILTPTTLLVEAVTGRSFAFESHAGYMSSDHTFLIAASCAGVNFLITAFLMLSLQRLWRDRRPGFSSSKLRGWIFLPVSAVLAYVATIIANTVRISVALQLQQTPPQISWLNANQLHRLEGVFVYFGFLLLLFVITEKAMLTAPRKDDLRESKSLSYLRMSFFPLLIYYATTLGLPLVNGAYRQTAFWEHSLFVLLTPLGVIILIVAVLDFRHRLYRTGARRLNSSGVERLLG